MRIVCSLVSVTVIFQLELFLILLHVNYRNVCSRNRPQHRVLPGSSISAPWRVDFRNWQVDYSYTWYTISIYTVCKPSVDFIVVLFKMA